MPDQALLLRWTVSSDSNFEDEIHYELVARDKVTNEIVSNVSDSIGGEYDPDMMGTLASELGIVLD